MLQTKLSKDQKEFLKWLLSEYRTYEEHFNSDPVKFEFARKSLDAWGVRQIPWRERSRSEAASMCRIITRLEARGLIRRRDQRGLRGETTHLQFTVEGRALAETLT